MFELIATIPVWEQILTYIAITAIVLSLIAQTFIVICTEREAREMRKREERKNLRSPEWADTLLYWRTRE